jgi:hypothetical protein
VFELLAASDIAFVAKNLSMSYDVIIEYGGFAAPTDFLIA